MADSDSWTDMDSSTSRDNSPPFPSPWTESINLDVAKLRADVLLHGTRRELHGPSVEILQANLCKYCAIIFDNWNNAVNFMKDDRFHRIASPYHETIREVRQSSLTGCGVCSKVISYFEVHSSKWRSGVSHDSSARLEILAELPDEDYWSLRIYHSETRQRILEIGSARNPQIECINSNSQTDLQLGALDNSTSQARRWLQTCVEQHQKCRWAPGSFVPTRLVKLNDQVPRLYLAKEDKNLTYATLSHCWGSVPCLKLHKDNLATLQSQIPLQNLHKTFLDAFQIAAAMGFQYIWVDSLCIIQDDTDDWRREAGRMKDVYGSSALNIAATAASDGTKGCLFYRHPTHPKIELVRTFRHGRAVQLEVLDERGVFDDMANSPIVKRAWILQERILAPRTLHFAKSQLMWECHDLDASETFPDGDTFVKRQGSDDYADHLKNDRGGNWPVIVRTYSEAQLSYPGDRAVALAGIARATAALNNDTYLFGLWRSTLIRDISWFNVGAYADFTTANAKRTLSSTGAVFPSWSWLSVSDSDTGLFVPDRGLPDGSHVCYIQFIDVDFEYVGEDIFGDITRGTLHLDACYLMPVVATKVKFGEHDRTMFTLQHHDHELPVAVDLPDVVSGDLMFMPIGVSPDPNMARESVKEGIIPQCWGLLLRRLSDAQGHFERIGVVQVLDHGDGLFYGPKLCQKGEPCFHCFFLECFQSYEGRKGAADGVVMGQACCRPDRDTCASRTDEKGREWFRITID